MPRLFRIPMSAASFVFMVAVYLPLAAQATERPASTSPTVGTITVPPSNTSRKLPNQDSAVPIPDGQIHKAVALLDVLATHLMRQTGIPGMAVAVVHNGKRIYAKGFGVRSVKNRLPVGPDTVFQLASISKSVAATVVAHEVARGKVSWNTPVREHLPWFELADPYVSRKVTIGDLFSHRSGLPNHVGDLLEDLGYNRREILKRLCYVPLAPFRITYAYTNFGLTAAAEAAAAATGTDWAVLSEQAIYRPLDMASTSSRFADYKARRNRAVGHVKVNGYYVVGPERDPDAQSPAGGVSSSANDMAKWLIYLLAKGEGHDGKARADAALLPAISPQIVSMPPTKDDTRAGFYGYGFNVSTSASGRVTLSHSGAFDLGAATCFLAIPSANVAIVVLTNTSPIGVPETLAAEFADLVQFGHIRHDWHTLYAKAMAPLLAPIGSLVGKPRPIHPAPSQPLNRYVGTYRNKYYGPLQVVEDHNHLKLRLGPKRTEWPLTHWAGNDFTFRPGGENAPPGTISMARFSRGKVVLEYYDNEGLGTFIRQPQKRAY